MVQVSWYFRTYSHHRQHAEHSFWLRNASDLSQREKRGLCAPHAILSMYACSAPTQPEGMRATQ